MEAMTERRTVTMYPQHWAVVNSLATQMALRDGGNPARYTSAALRHIVAAFDGRIVGGIDWRAEAFARDRRRLEKRNEPTNEPAA